MGEADTSFGRFGDTVGPKQSTTVNMAFSSLEEEIMAGGWTRDQMPTGKTPPPRMLTAGGRGESQLDDDITPGCFDQSGYSES